MGNMLQQENNDFEHYNLVIHNKTLVILCPCYKAILETLLMLMCSKPYGITGKPQLNLKNFKSCLSSTQILNAYLR